MARTILNLACDKKKRKTKDTRGLSSEQTETGVSKEFCDKSRVMIFQLLFLLWISSLEFRIERNPSTSAGLCISQKITEYICPEIEK